MSDMVIARKGSTDELESLALSSSLGHGLERLDATACP